VTTAALAARGVARGVPLSALAAVVVVGVAALLRGINLGHWALEQDELYTLRDATDLGASSTGPGIKARPVYYLLQHLLLALLPPTALLLRLPAFVFGVAGVWVTWLLGRRAFGSTAGLVAAALVTVSPWHLYESQLARYWTLVYLLAACALLALQRARDTERPGAYLLAAGVIGLGILTHPTFAFPFVGALPALTLARSEGGRLPLAPARQAWRWLWLPLLGGALAGLVLLKATGSESSLRNWGGRGAANLLLIPAMVQWMTPVTATATALAAAWLASRGAGADRRWGMAALLGMGSAATLLLLAAVRTDVYADYGMAALPLAYVAIGGAVERLGTRAGAAGREVMWGATALLVASALPGAASHLLDGSRFDYRPVYEYLQRRGANELVVGWPVINQRYYAPELRFAELVGDTTRLSDLARREAGIWLVTSHQRHGIVMDDGALTEWVHGRCQRVLRTGATRLDYRSYHVVLSWCHDQPETPGRAGERARVQSAGPAGARDGS
jgi:hypothetical protein